MPQPVKYSTSSVPNAIKKGNMAIGVNQVEYSPTSTTGWYAGISPPVSGYTVYVNKATQGPSILVASNDTDLVSVARSQGASASVTTAAGALNYFASQSDMMVVNKNYNDIVTSGLVMNWDASFVASYPVSGTSWYDISGSGNTGTLNNGPTFNSSGYFVFDGTDDSITRSYNSTFNIRSGITLYVLFRRNSIFTQLSDCFILSRPPAWYFYDEYNAGTIRGDVFIDGTRRGNRSVAMPNDGRWYEFVYTYDSSTGWAIMYRNGTAASSTQVTGLSNYLIDSSSANFLSIFSSNVGKSYFVNSLRIYNRALSATEISQNYYGGPIVTNGLTFAVDAGNLVSFQNGSGSTFSLVGSYTGTLQNGVSYTTGGGGGWVFDGTDDYINILNGSFGYSPGTTGELSLEVWINPTGPFTSYTLAPPTTNLAGVFGQGYFNNSVGWGLGIVVITGVGNCFSFQVRNLSNSVSVGSSLTSGYATFTTNQWYHLVGTFTRNDLSRLYVNGILTSSTSSVSLNNISITPSLTDAALSRAGSTGQFYTGCNIGVARLYTKPLSTAEVAQNFNAQKRRFGF